MKISKRQLRKIIKEVVTAINDETGEVWEGEPLGIPHSAWPNIVKRLDLEVLGMGDLPYGDYELSDEDFGKLEDETWGKQQTRSVAVERKRLDGKRITAELVELAASAGQEYQADNSGTDLEGGSYDLAQSLRHSVAPDEWVQAVWYMFDEMGGFHLADNTYEDAEEALLTMLADHVVGGLPLLQDQ